MNQSIGTYPRADDAPLASGRLAQLGLLRFAGPDALSFLQGQLSNDTARLSHGAPLLAAYSTPQGRVLAVLHLLPHSSGVMAILPRELSLSTAQRMQKYVLRAKVKIEDVSEQFAVFGRMALEVPPGEALAAPDSMRTYAERDGIGVARLGADRNRYWMVGTLEALAGHGIDDAAQEPRAEHAWRLADIRAGIPQVYASTSEMFVAQMLNLDLIDGISFTKGCFTGQEIVARTQHLGRIKRRLYRLRLPAGAWAVGQPVHLADGRSGRLTELAATGAEFEALAVLTREAGGVPASGADETGDDGAAKGTLVDAIELPLPYSLVPA